MAVNGSDDSADGRSLEDIEQALLADDPDFVRRLRRATDGLPGAAAAPDELRLVLLGAWCVAGVLVLVCLAGGSLVGAAGTCVLALVLHRRTRGSAPVAAPPPPRPARRGPGRSTPAAD